MKKFWTAFISFLILVLFAVILIIPKSREVFSALSKSHPFSMAFIKFGLMATIGEIFAIRLSKKEWCLPTYVVSRAIIWGLIGIAITFMMTTFKGGVSALTDANTGVLFAGKDGTILNKFLKAFYTSAIMNLTFGPTFMAFHKCTDKMLELKSQGKPHKVFDAIGEIDFKGFVGFTLFKTIPLFWIPAHTITFLLPPQYQVIMAASLSIVLGVILSIKK